MKIKNYLIAFLSLFLIGSTSVIAQTNWVEVNNSFGANNIQTIVLQNNDFYVATMYGNSIEIKKKDSWMGSFTTITADATNTMGALEYILFDYYDSPAIVFKDLNNALRLQVYDGSAFEIVGDYFWNPDFEDGLSLSVDPETGNLYVATTSAGANQGVDVYLFDGVNWSNLVSQFNSTATDATTPQIHVDGDMAYLAFKEGVEMLTPTYVYKVQKDLLSNANLVQHTVSGDLLQITEFKMKGEPYELPYFLSTDGSASQTINISRLTTTGSEDFGGINTYIGGPGFDFSLYDNEVKFVHEFDNAGTLELRAQKWTLANSFEELAVDPFIIAEQTWDYSIISPPNNGRTVVSYIANVAGSNYGKISLTNRLPLVYEFQQNPICEGAGNQYVSLFETLVLKDLDFDKINFTAVESTDYGVIEASVNLSIIPITEYNPYTNTQEFDIIAQNIGVSGTTTLTLYVNDGIQTIELTIPFVVSPPPNSTVTLDGIEACLNDDLIDLNEAVGGIYNGRFFYNGEQIPEGMFDPSTYTFSGDLIKFIHPDMTSGCLLEDFITPTIHTPSEISVNVTPTSCGDNTGTAELMITTPVEPNTIYWSNGKSDVMMIEDLGTGQYFVNLVDGNGCLSVAPANIMSIEAIVTENIVNLTCFGNSNGSIALNISGPDAPYTVLWNTGQSTPTIANLPAGTYDVVIRGNSGCQFSKTYSITQPSKIKVNYGTVSYIEPNCGSNDGQISPIAEGGTGPLSFEWNNGQNTQIANNLGAGIYSLNVTDQAGCQESFEFTLNNTGSIGITALVSQPTCGMQDGKIRVAPSNPWMVESIVWSNSVMGVNNPNIPVGEYTCELTDWSGCKTFRKWALRGKRPLLNEICIVTVDSATTTNLVVWEREQLSGIDYYNIYRESSVAGNYILIDTVSAQNLTVFNDVVASPMNRSWRYKISAVDFCGVEGPVSPTHKTIHLVKSKISETEYQVTWDKYEGVIDGDLEFYRHTNELGWELVGVYPITQNSITDTPGSEEGLDYMVEIVPSEPCTATRAQDYNSSRSNKANSIFNPGEGTGDSHNSVNENDGGVPVTIYPNPTEGLLTIISDSENVTGVTVYNASGAIVDEFEFSSEVVKNYDYLQSGVYYLKLTSDGNQTIKKLILY